MGKTWSSDDEPFLTRLREGKWEKIRMQKAPGEPDYYKATFGPDTNFLSEFLYQSRREGKLPDRAGSYTAGNSVSVEEHWEGTGAIATGNAAPVIILQKNELDLLGVQVGKAWQR